jgi:hypothetical protein
MLQLTIKSLEYQRQMVKGGERIKAAMEEGRAPEASDAPGGEIPNPALWAWNMMAQAGTDAAEAMGRAVEAAGEAAKDPQQSSEGRPKAKAKASRKKSE